MSQEQFNANRDALNLAAQASQGAMDNAHQSAENTRQLANALGINSELFGENVSLQDAKNIMGNIGNAARNSLLYGEQFNRTSDEFFEDKYRELRQQGRTHRDATILAGDAAREYQANRRAALNQGLNLFGRTDNRINDVGMDIISKLAQENPEMANLNVNSYALPKNEYNNAFDWQKLQFADAAAMEKLLAQFGQQINLANLNNNARERP